MKIPQGGGLDPIQSIPSMQGAPEKGKEKQQEPARGNATLPSQEKAGRVMSLIYNALGKLRIIGQNNDPTIDTKA